jgi:hypothetical protein
MSESEQKSLLRDLQRHCKGKGRAHLFLAGEWILTTRATNR